MLSKQYVHIATTGNRLSTTMRCIVEAQEYKDGRWYHIGYLRILFNTALDAQLYAAEYEQSTLSLQTRLVVREYDNEYLTINKPYYEEIERLRSCPSPVAERRARGVKGWMIETQLALTYKPCISSGVGAWRHRCYSAETYDSEAIAYCMIAELEQLERERIDERGHGESREAMRDNETDSKLRYVVRPCYGEARDVKHVYGMHDNKLVGCMTRPIATTMAYRVERV